MARSSMPNMTALLGLLALAGYRNRDKIGEMLSKAQEALTGKGSADAESSRELNDSFSGPNAGGTISGGLGDLMDRFKQSGQRQTADSWLGAGPNKQVAPDSLEQVIGDETLSELTAKTGMSKAEILARLSTDLPEAVNDFTPMGRLPTEQEVRRYR